MQIAVVKRKYSLKSGGSERYCVNLVRKLKERGHDLTVVGERIDDDLADEVRFIPLKTNRLTSWTSNRSFAEAAREAVSGRGFDIVYGLGRVLGVDVMRVTERLQSHWLRVRYQPRWYESIQRSNPRHRTMIDLEQSILHAESTRRIVVQSSLDRRLLEECYGVNDERVRIVRNGVDTSAFHPGFREHREEVRREFGIGQTQPLFLFASMDFEGKGLRSIMNALAQQTESPALIVLGEGPVRKFSNLAQQLGIASQVHFGGRRSDIARFYGASDLSVLPSAYEPFPNVNLESMACGTPVVTSTTAGGVDIVEPGINGYLVDGVHCDSQLGAIFAEHLTRSSDELERMSNQCWELAQTLTVDRTADATLSVFQEVLNDRLAA